MKSLFTCTLVLLFCLPFSKESEAQEFGLKAGPNFHTVTGEDIEDNKMKFGFHLGGFLQVEMADQVYFRPELLYSLEGSGYEVEFMGQSFESTTNFSYIAIPLMGRISLDGLYFDAGPSIGLLLGGNTVSDGESEDLDMDNYNTLELAAELGGGYEMENGLSFGLRADLGLTGIWDVPDDAPDDVSNATNLGIRISSAYTF